MSDREHPPAGRAAPTERDAVLPHEVRQSLALLLGSCLCVGAAALVGFLLI